MLPAAGIELARAAPATVAILGPGFGTRRRHALPRRADRSAARECIGASSAGRWRPGL